MSYKEIFNRNNTPEDKHNEILSDSKIWASKIKENKNFINISEIPKNLNPYSQEADKRNSTSKNEPNGTIEATDDIAKKPLTNLKNIIKIPDFFKWHIENDEKNVETNLTKVDYKMNKIQIIRSPFTKDINDSPELRNISLSSIFTKFFEENKIQTGRETYKYLSETNNLRTSFSYKKSINTNRNGNSYFSIKKEIDEIKDDDDKLKKKTKQSITKIYLNKFEKLFALYDLLEVDKKNINLEEKNVGSSNESTANYESFIFNLCNSLSTYPIDNNIVVYISGKNYIEYEYNTERENIFTLEKVNDCKYKDAKSKELDSFIQKQPVSNNIMFFETGKKRKRPRKSKLMSNKNNHPIKNTKNKIAKKSTTSKNGNKKIYYLNEFNVYGNSLDGLVRVSGLKEKSVTFVEILENIFQDKQIKNIFKIKKKPKKPDPMDNLEKIKNTELTLTFHSEKKELGVYKIHSKTHEIKYIIYLYYSIIKKNIELLNKNFYSHGRADKSKSLCYKISFFINKCNNFIKKITDGTLV